MAAAILELIQNRELAARCAENGLRLARDQFSFDQMMQHKLRVDLQIAKKNRTTQEASVAPLSTLSGHK
jgi:hypothetical protein